MHSTKRTLALAVAGVLLAACSHKDKDAPLAFVPADTPYVVANLDVLDDDTRSALLAQANAQLPAQVAQMKIAADQLATKNPDGARLLRAFIAELDGKTAETFAQNVGLNLKGYSAFYGFGLAPVMRFQLTDPKAFDAFVGRLETAYGKKFDVATLGGQTYRKHVSAESGTEVILATVGKQAVAALLPADAPEPMLRQVLGLDRPDHDLQEDGRLTKLAKDRGYGKWGVGDLDLARALPLAASGKDPLFNALFKAHAATESAKTGEPVATQTQIPASCQGDAARIAGRVSQISFGYTKLDAKHQDMRWDVALASDITQAFAGLKVELPGLGAGARSPFDFSLALPVAQLRTFWSVQAEAVAAKPFTCPAFSGLNDGFSKLGMAMQKAATPPFGNFLGVRIALDSFSAAAAGNAMPKFSGRLVVGTSDPAGLLAMGQMMTPALAQLKVGNDGKPAALPPAMTAQFGQPAWLAMGPKALALGVGQGEDAKLGDSLKDATGDAGQMLRMSLSGDMYLNWVNLMRQRMDSVAATTDALTKANHPDGDNAATEQASKSAAAARKAQFDAMQAQAQRIKSINAEIHVEDQGMVGTTQTELK